MMFCPKCGSIMVLGKSDSKKHMTCASCGYSSKDLAQTKIIEEIRQEDAKNIDVVKADEDEKTLPKTEADCPKCHHAQAFYWLVQTRAGDEAETKFLRCAKCKHIWREYD